MLAQWKASRDAEAKLIGAQAEEDALEIGARSHAKLREILIENDVLKSTISTRLGRDTVQSMLEFQTEKRATDLLTIVRSAAAQLGDSGVEDQTPDPAFTARFFADSQDVTSEILQEIWAQILAGQVR